MFALQHDSSLHEKPKQGAHAASQEHIRESDVGYWYAGQIFVRALQIARELPSESEDGESLADCVSLDATACCHANEPPTSCQVVSRMNPMILQGMETKITKVYVKNSVTRKLFLEDADVFGSFYFTTHSARLHADLSCFYTALSVLPNFSNFNFCKAFAMVGYPAVQTAGISAAADVFVKEVPDGILVFAILERTAVLFQTEGKKVVMSLGMGLRVLHESQALAAMLYLPHHYFPVSCPFSDRKAKLESSILTAFAQVNDPLSSCPSMIGWGFGAAVKFPFQQLDVTIQSRCLNMFVQLEQCRIVASVCKCWLSLLKNAQTWENHVVDVSEMLFNEKSLSQIAAWIVRGRRIYINGKQEKLDIHFPIDTYTCWRALPPYDNGTWVTLSDTTKFSISDSCLPVRVCGEIRIMGNLRGISLGLTSADSIAELMQCVRPDNSSQSPMFAAMYIAFESTQAPSRWHFNGTPEDVLPPVPGD
eukprot:1534495-Karenia_brevis.AAC.1